MSEIESSARVVVALGGNLGGDNALLGRFASAVGVLQTVFGQAPMRTSGVYRSRPVGPVSDQPHFLNAAVEFAVPARVEPVAVLSALLDLETALGRERQRAVPQGPRAIDLDLLFVGARVLDNAGPPPLCLPHPRIAERAFVLRPLADLQGLDWLMPGIGRTVGHCLAETTVVGQCAELELVAATVPEPGHATMAGHANRP